MKKIKLTKEEQEIEDNAEKFVPLSTRNRALMERALEKARKESTISLRITGQDLYELKQLAQQEGLPYQSFITSILHKYINRRLIDKEQVKNVAELLGAN